MKLSNRSVLRVVLVIFGDDPYELFDFNNLPVLELYLGAEVEGYRALLASVLTVPGAPRVKKPRFVKVRSTSHRGLSFADGDLMRQNDLPSFPCRFQYGQANFKGGLFPSAIAKERAVIHRCVVEFSNDA